jgi:hypothetical protein
LTWAAVGAAEPPDLIVKIRGPAEARPGEDLGEQVEVVVKNRGQRPALGTVEGGNGYVIDVVLSRRRDLEVKPATYSENFHDGVMLRGGRISRTTTLQPGQTESYRTGAVVPRDTPEGVYCLGAIVDSFRGVRESNEANNVACATIRIQSGRPDLYVSQFQMEPDPPVQGQPVSVRVGVYNKGESASGGFRVEWWAGKNFPGPACTWNVEGLRARGGRILRCTYKGYRSWYASLDTKVFVDVHRNVQESDERNNVMIKTISVRRD